METTAIILRGPIGVGKSTIAEELKEELSDGWVHLDIDKLKHVISKDSSKLRTTIAHNVALYFLEQLIKNRFNVIVEEIFKEKIYRDAQDLLGRYNYKILKVFLTTPVDVSIERDKNRKNKTRGEKVVTDFHNQIKPLGEDLTIDTSKHSLEEAAELILKALN
ncbi:MAG: hypothetical protein A3A33_04190 [Candidatus Yanofskybacteria bacterium RIFCSPLOWO2_01_FULL_49_25]|uniref:UDP-N-acetylglucosamine kinase n=1 Tax=Candidatus Yanofskybacteria bacterium RIFCSPLOWO2_01_FULL_49_25 TaxID=1802701 RepID=A0A1F8GRD0_9BACT|nr:MAG: hypothetical protein A3A33_04190 [Candidatus Yanofskybacteria bacterium RIFCSPLOWO2_01_FULL_49_25]